jgi:hypothetical protein
MEPAPGMLHRVMKVRVGLVVTVLLGLLATACTGGPPFMLAASGPTVYSTTLSPALERVAVLVTISNRSGDDLQINPADFVTRDAEHRIFPANAAATVADARLVEAPPTMRGSLPLPTVTLRGNDLVAGFVVFDVPAGVRPVELIWRQTDTDCAVPIVTTT